MESDKKVFEVEKKRFFLNTRQKTIFFISLSLLFVLYVFIHGSLIKMGNLCEILGALNTSINSTTTRKIRF